VSVSCGIAHPIVEEAIEDRAPNVISTMNSLRLQLTPEPVDVISICQKMIIESLLKTALDGEALFTILLGKPAITPFAWQPSEELQNMLETVVGTADSIDIHNWVCEFLHRTPLGPPVYFSIPSSVPCLACWYV
jgi:hypothetical protein